MIGVSHERLTFETADWLFDKPGQEPQRCMRCDTKWAHPSALVYVNGKDEPRILSHKEFEDMMLKYGIHLKEDVLARHKGLTEGDNKLICNICFAKSLIRQGKTQYSHPYATGTKKDSKKVHPVDSERAFIMPKHQAAAKYVLENNTAEDKEHWLGGLAFFQL